MRSSRTAESTAASGQGRAANPGDIAGDDDVAVHVKRAVHGGEEPRDQQAGVGKFRAVQGGIVTVLVQREVKHLDGVVPTGRAEHVAQSEAFPGGQAVGQQFEIHRPVRGEVPQQRIERDEQAGEVPGVRGRNDTEARSGGVHQTPGSSGLRARRKACLPGRSEQACLRKGVGSTCPGRGACPGRAPPTGDSIRVGATHWPKHGRLGEASLPGDALRNLVLTR